jgi:hypothetical protein
VDEIHVQKRPNHARASQKPARADHFDWNTATRSGPFSII